MNLGNAIALTATKFENKFDKAGQPYILHCLRVMNSVKGINRQIAAVLHDVVEDTEITLSDLLEMGYSAKVVAILQLLTHDKKVSYENYIKLIGTNEDAIEIKLADLDDNSRITRLKGVAQKDVDRMIKYHKAYTYLKSIQNENHI